MTLSPEEQRILIKRYQTLKEIPTDQSSQLPATNGMVLHNYQMMKNKKCDIWQKMSTQERNNLRKQMQNASLEERVTIRDEYLNKYSEH